MASPKLVLYNNRLCPYAARAVVALDETKAAHEVIEINLSEPRPDWYLKDINPYGQVPSLKVNDSDVILESLFVSEYVSDLHPEANLLPSDPLLRAKVRNLIYHWDARVQPAHRKATFTLDPKEAAAYHETLIVELGKFNNLLLNVPNKESNAAGPFYLGEQFSLAEVAIGPHLVRFFLVEQYNGNKLPTVKSNPELAKFFNWKDAVLERASIKKVSPPQDELVQVYKKWLVQA
ncbi:hypothetical protein BGW38_006272 [Lunasporangiospora selenospora]|uniref:Glutathione S-transferase n=1 Tax=Lunasporangiospora selenospora TaxID=979761 RepID=A0A9P6G5T2_9FUNG|nr:hypothetical protein BGW38_006272 [Lunasporangiospora selenospora]